MTNGIFNDTNTGRVKKMQETLGLLQKSIDSNKAPSEDVWKLLQPVINDISAMVGAKAQKPEQATPVEAPATTEPRTEAETPKDEPQWYTLHKLAKEAPLKELNRVVAIYVNRVDEEL